MPRPAGSPSVPCRTRADRRSADRGAGRDRRPDQLVPCPAVRLAQHFRIAARCRGQRTLADQPRRGRSAVPLHRESHPDITTLRDRARREIEKGPVTEAYGADLERVLQVLNEALATEIVCTLRYKRHYYTASGLYSEPVAAEFLEHAAQEQEHADKVAQRIVQLGGKPDFNIGLIMAVGGGASRCRARLDGDRCVRRSGPGGAGRWASGSQRARHVVGQREVSGGAGDIEESADDLVERAGDDELALLPVMGTLGGEQDVQHRGVGEVGERQIDDGTWSAGLLRQRAGLFQQRGAVVIEGPADADDKGLVLDSVGHHSRCMNVHGRQHAMLFGHRF